MTSLEVRGSNSLEGFAKIERSLFAERALEAGLHPRPDWNGPCKKSLPDRRQRDDAAPPILSRHTELSRGHAPREGGADARALTGP